MNRCIRIFALTVLVLAPAIAVAQAPPKLPKPPAAAEPGDPKACAHNRATVGAGGGIEVQKPDGRDLSDQLARSDGVICPPTNVDPEIKEPAPPGGAMRVIPPPGSPGGDQSVRPK